MSFLLFHKISLSYFVHMCLRVIISNKDIAFEKRKKILLLINIRCLTKKCELSVEGDVDFGTTVVGETLYRLF